MSNTENRKVDIKQNDLQIKFAGRFIYFNIKQLEQLS